MLDRPAPSQRDRLDMYNANALKLGLFGANCSSGRSATKVPERWSASWEDCLALAKMGDAAGIDFMLPIGRWKGYGGDTDLHGEIAGDHHLGDRPARRHRPASPASAPSTRRCFIRSSPPSRCVTADHIGEGRFGLNIVAGWNEGEFEMFGVQQREHEARYAYAQEWVDAIKMAWAEGDDVSFDGEHIKLKKIRAKPKPYGGTRPLIMNAGSSGAGQAFALRNCDAFFTATSTSRQGVDAHQGDGRGHQAEGPRLRPRDRGVHCRPDRLPRRPRRRPRTTTTTPSSRWPTGARSSA